MANFKKKNDSSRESGRAIHSLIVCMNHFPSHCHSDSWKKVSRHTLHPCILSTNLQILLIESPLSETKERSDDLKLSLPSFFLLLRFPTCTAWWLVKTLASLDSFLLATIPFHACIMQQIWIDVRDEQFAHEMRLR